MSILEKLKLNRFDPRFCADYVSKLSPTAKKSLFAGLSVQDLKAIMGDWAFWARDDQLPPLEWGENGCFIWNVRAGRGFGKTRMSAEVFIRAVQYGGYKYPNLAGATAEDVRGIQIEGESGILACAPEDFRPEYIPSLKKLVWPNGVVSNIYYGSEPDKARGPQSDFLWCDEIAKWRAPEETFDNLLMGLRLGPCPLCIVTSTPRPTRFLMDLEKRTDRQGRPSTVTTRGRTQDNFRNLSPVFINTIISKYQGTRIGLQELSGEFLEDNPDALWRRADIDNNRVFEIPDLTYIVVGIDPAVTSKTGSDDTGIIVAGKGTDGHGYVLGDYTVHDTPKKWAEAAITAFHKHQADLIVGENNNGGDLVEMNVKALNSSIPFKSVHASRGKAIRAGPISTLYEQNLVHHFGTFFELETQMCEWVPGAEKSPDRVDALVWALTQLNIKEHEGFDFDLPTGYPAVKQEDYFSRRYNPDNIWEGMGFDDGNERNFW